MTHFLRLTLGTPLSIFLVSNATNVLAQTAQHKTVATYILACRGVTTSSTSLQTNGPEATTKKSTDELRIVRYGRTLQVQSNIAMYRGMDSSTRRILEKPEPYKITAETGEGLLAIWSNELGSLHTLTLDRSLKYAIWSESGFSFLPPQSEPINYTVSLTCKRQTDEQIQ